jgi:hypothetical protein
MPPGESIYHLSRALYRRLEPLVPDDEGNARLKQLVLDGCEWTMRRMAAEPSFSQPERFLFSEIRMAIPLSEQGYARRLIEAYLALTGPMIAKLRRAQERRCSASNRFGARCRRPARRGSAFCPTHGQRLR